MDKVERKLEEAVKALHKRLDVPEHLARCKSTFFDGKKGRGYRIVVTRLADAMTASRFVKC